jgi:formate-dependent nitrite reductase membrane component NrfD
MAITDLAGVPLALVMTAYTGVLLSGSATPAWSKNPWLGALFSPSAISTGAAAISLALAARGLRVPAHDEPAHAALKVVDLAAHIAEGVTLGGYLYSAGDLARPLTHGPMALPFWGGLLGMAGSELLKWLSGRSWSQIPASLFGLAGGFALRWAFVHAGPPSANDPDAARCMSRPRQHP